MEEEIVNISKKEYQELIIKSYFLDCLQGAGVDNWQGYDDAIDLFNQQYKDDLDDLDELPY